MSLGPSVEDEALFEELRSVARADAAAQSAPSIPGYELQAEIQRGGQGIVHRALQLSTQRLVALKVLTLESGSYRDRLRFEREVDLACRLQHPGIVTIHDRGVAAFGPWFAMELVEGRTLDLWLSDARPSQRARLELFHALCLAVAHAHRHGVIHRDLKPSNVLVDDAGAPHVLDFGVARALDDTRAIRVTRTGEFAGTLSYASPEQVVGEPGSVETRTDVYSLGVVLYEMLTGRLPYDVSGPMSEVIGRIAHTAPGDPGVDRDLAAILATALAKAPAERYASVEDLARDVAHFLADEPIEARARGAWYELRKGFARHRLAVLGTAAALVAVALGVAFLARERLSAERQREHAELVREIFQDVLAAAAPERMGGDVRLLEMFEEASRRIEESLVDAPDAQAAVQLTIGDTYRRLLMMQDAEPHLRRAVERYRVVDGPQRLEVAKALDLLGLVLAALNDPEAIPVQEEALALRRAALEPDDPLIAASERGLALALVAQWRAGEAEFTRAEELCSASLERLRATLGDEDPETAESLMRLGILRCERHSPDAEELLTRALAVFDARAPEDPRRIECLTAWASFLQRERRFDEAEEAIVRSVALTEELFGEKRSVDMLRRQARLRFARGDLVTAEELSRRALAHALEDEASRAPEKAAELRALAARMTAASGEPPPWASAFAALRAQQGDGAFELAGWANGICQVLNGLGRAAETEPMLREALHIRCRAFGADCPLRRETLERLSGYLVGAGRCEEARPLLEESLETARRLEGADSESALHVRELLDDCPEHAR